MGSSHANAVRLCKNPEHGLSDINMPHHLQHVVGERLLLAEVRVPVLAGPG